MFKSHRSLTVATVFSLLLPLTGGFFSRLEARAGDLDLTFDLDGMVTTDFFGREDEGSAVILQPDGKIVVAGFTYIYTPGWDQHDFALARYLANGTLDPTFGNGGKVMTDFNGSRDFGSAVALQPDGKVVVAGGTEGPSGIFALARYQAKDGALDPAFGNGGKVTTDFDGREEFGSAVALQPDGKIVVAGTGVRNELVAFALARYKENGDLDPDFGNGGKVMTNFDGQGWSGHAITLQPDGKMVVAGDAWGPNGYDFALARYLANGTLDPAFGNGGVVTTNFNGRSSDIGRGVALQPDGMIVVTGVSQGDFALARYRANGVLDPTFGNGGMVTTDFNGLTDIGRAIIVQMGGKIVVAGTVASDQNRVFGFALARYKADGALDPAFGNGGKVTTDSWGSSLGPGLAIQPDCKIVVGGNVSTNGYDFALARYKGDPDISGKYDYSLTALWHDAPFSEGCPIGFECVRPITDCNVNSPHLFGPVTGLINLKQQCDGKLTGDIGFFGGKQIPLNGSVDFNNNYWSFTVDEHQEQIPNPDGTVCTLSVSALFSGKVEPFDCSWGGGAVVAFTKVNGNCDSIMGQKNQCLVAYDKAVCTKQ